MKLYYIRLPNSNVEKAEQLSQALLVKHRQTIWSNWFPIDGTNSWADSLEKGTEIGVLLYTEAGYREHIDKVICDEIGRKQYFVTEKSPDSANKSFLVWLDKAVPKNTPGKALVTDSVMC
jgi:uncharacterized protein involved in tolerance to divalent cations